MYAKHIVYETFGTPHQVISIKQKALNRLKPNEIRVKMSLAPINPSDYIPITGAYKHRISLPATPGYEGVGTVLEVGNDRYNHLLGKRVLPLLNEGTWQQYVTADANFAVHIPDQINDVIASQMYINPVTALVITKEILQLKKGDTLVVNASNSAIGRIFIQLAKIYNFKVIAIIRNEAHITHLKALGAYHVIHSKTNNIQEVIDTLTDGIGATAAIDSIGGSDGTKLAFTLKQNGTLITIGLLSGEQINWQRIHHETNIQLYVFHLRHWLKDKSSMEWQRIFKEIIHLIETKRLFLIEDAVIYPFEAVQKALEQELDGTSKKGKRFLQF